MVSLLKNWDTIYGAETDNRLMLQRSMEGIIGLTRCFSSHFAALQQNIFKKVLLFSKYNKEKSGFSPIPRGRQVSGRPEGGKRSGLAPGSWLSDWGARVRLLL